VLGGHVERKVEVPYKRGTVGAKPDSLSTAVPKRGWSELTDYLRCKLIVFADGGAGTLILAEQLWHVSLKLRFALGCRRRSLTCCTAIPGFSFGAACKEALPPGVSRRVLADRDEAPLHGCILPKNVCERARR